MVERHDPDNFARFQTRERCALEIAAYVFKLGFLYYVCAYIHIIYGLVLTTCIKSFHAYDEVFNILFSLIFSS